MKRLKIIRSTVSCLYDDQQVDDQWETNRPKDSVQMNKQLTVFIDYLQFSSEF